MDADDLEQMDAKLIADALDTNPSPYPKLFVRVNTGANAYVRTGYIYEAGLVDDFFGLAREAAERVPEGADAEQKILPVLFLYRHAVELALKLARRQLIRAVLQHEDFKPGAVDRHELGVLLGEVRGLHRRAHPYLKDSVGRVKFISSQAEAFILEIDQVDPTGQGFRYSHDKDGKAVVRDADVGIDALIAGMRHVENELHWFISMIENSVDLLAQWNADMEADFGGYDSY